MEIHISIVVYIYFIYFYLLDTLFMSLTEEQDGMDIHVRSHNNEKSLDLITDQFELDTDTLLY